MNHLSLALGHAEIERRVAEVTTRRAARLTGPRGHHTRHLPLAVNRAVRGSPQAQSATTSPALSGRGSGPPSGYVIHLDAVADLPGRGHRHPPAARTRSLTCR